MRFSEETQRRLEGVGFCAVIALIVTFICSTIWIGKKFDYQKKPDVQSRQTSNCEKS